MGMLDDWLNSISGGAPVGAFPGPALPPGAFPSQMNPPTPPQAPSGMLASLFTGSGLAPAGGTVNSMLSGAVPTTISPGTFPPTPGASAMASAAPGPPMDLSPLPAPRSPAASSGGQPDVPETSLLGRIGSALGKGLSDNSNMLIGLGAGMAGAPSLGVGLSRGLSQALPASQIDRQQGIQNQTAQMLMKKMPGMTPEMAMTVATNPAAMQQILPRLVGAKSLVFGVIGKNPYGVEQYGFHDDVSGTVYDQNMHPVGGPGAPEGTGGVNGTGQSGGISPDLKGEELYSAIAANPQFGPGKANQVRALVEGRQPFPTGTALRVPGNQWLADMALQAEPGATAQDFHARQTTQNDLAKSGNSNLGGIILNGNSAFEHLGTYTDALTKLGNHSNSVLPNWEANLENRFKNQVIGNSETAGKINAANGAALKYGQESTKFYSGTGGGEGERMAALNNNDPVSKSAQELAGFAQTERDLMVGRMRETEQKIRQNMGEDWLQKHPVFTPELQQKIARVDANIAKLSGKSALASPPAAAQSAPAAKPPPPVGTIEDGHRFLGGDPANPASWASV